MSFWGELKRRNVFKVGAAYAVVAWLLIQIAGTLLPTFDAPPWVMPVFSTAVILGLPVAVLLAWAFELTPDGVKPTASVDPEQSITASTGQKLNYAITGLLAVAAVYMFVDNYVLDGPGPSDASRQAAAITDSAEPPPASADTPPPAATNSS